MEIKLVLEKVAATEVTDAGLRLRAEVVEPGGVRTIDVREFEPKYLAEEVVGMAVDHGLI